MASESRRSLSARVACPPRPPLPSRAPCEAAQLAAHTPAICSWPPSHPPPPPPGLPLRAAPLPPPAALAGLRRPSPQRVTINGSKPPGSDGDSGQARTYTSYPPTLRATKLASPT
ncbi:formin-like protein 5 [Penaeus chinensis]|uniref:formin-like protein 5 n=1 Tax=Penaeus chinensis TaxID=139456 RepID=UPI001FB7CB43|nr:formin-like protein 5 [Penaeus chinensis]